MTFADLYQVIERQIGDDSADRTTHRQWLNLARTYIAGFTVWPQALNNNASLSIDGRASGEYVLATPDCDQTYENISGDYIYDTSESLFAQHESRTFQGLSDPQRTVDGPPIVWADAGANASGERLIRFYPVPRDTRTYRFAGWKRLTDITVSNDTDTLDPYFGPLAVWQACFIEGIKYYANDDDNESATQTEHKRRVFERMIKHRMRASGVGRTNRMLLRNWKERGMLPRARLDPAHFNNG